MAEGLGPKGIARHELVALVLGIPLLIAAIIAAKPLVNDVIDRILKLNPTMVYVVVGLLVFAEAAIFIGFVFPGETAVILGGVVASDGRVNVVGLAAVVITAAIVGDSVGYYVGHRWGERVLKMKLLEHRRGGLDVALVMLRKRGAIAVFIGRFTAFLRAAMPGLAGLSRLRYRTFLAANALGGIAWGTLFTLIGYFVGNAYREAERYAGWASTALLILILLIAVGLFVRGRLRETKLESSFAAAEADPEGALTDELAAAREAMDADDDG